MQWAGCRDEVPGPQLRMFEQTEHLNVRLMEQKNAVGSKI